MFLVPRQVGIDHGDGSYADEITSTWHVCDHERRDSSGFPYTLLLHVLGAVAQFERDLILERTRAGLAAARARGRVGGRPLKMSLEKGGTRTHELMLNVDEIAATLKVSRRTLLRGLAVARTHDEIASGNFAVRDGVQ
jgi:DNA invertase Pin-like site-specific DNA recombinase